MPGPRRTVAARALVLHIAHEELLRHVVSLANLFRPRWLERGIQENAGKETSISQFARGLLFSFPIRLGTRSMSFGSSKKSAFSFSFTNGGSWWWGHLRG